MSKIKIVLAVAAVGFVVALVAFNTANPATPEVKAWNTALAKGNPDTGKHFIMYTDVFCPYCDKFSNALHANAEDFAKEYIDSGKIYYEMRVTHINYLSGHSENSQTGGESAYCAARQDKFWPYYKAILSKLYDDYHSRGIGISKTAEKIPLLDNSYYYEAGETAQLDSETFRSCLENHETLDELTAATTKAQKILTGVPYFVFGDYKANGFDGNWDTTNDYRQAQLMLSAGL